MRRLLSWRGYEVVPLSWTKDFALEPEFLAFYDRCAPFTMTSRERMFALYQATRYVQSMPGAVVECGVWRGGSMMMSALTLEALDDDRDIYLFDTFAGMTEPS